MSARTKKKATAPERGRKAIVEALQTTHRLGLDPASAEALTDELLAALEKAKVNLRS